VSTEQQSWWQRRRPLILRTLGFAGAVVLVAGFVWLWWRGVPALYRDAGGGEDGENARLSAVTTTRAALLAGFVGLGALGTFWLNSRVYRITARTFELTERGHLTERYSKAIEQLGDEKLDVRLGGIYALEQIATDSPRTRDQATIVEVLSAFVRVHSDPLYQYRASLPESVEPEPLEQQRDRAAEYVAQLAKPPVDIQAAVTVLGRLPDRPAVSRGDLSDASLNRFNLLQANFTGAILSEADLSGADLNGADLNGAKLRGADLNGAKLRGADLRGADLRGADLSRAILNRAILNGAILNGADLSEADLSEAILNGAILSRAILSWADLSEADLSWVRGLTQEQLTETSGDAETRLPPGLERPAWWGAGELPADIKDTSTDPAPPPSETA